jgi:hypothetical protein
MLIINMKSDDALSENIHEKRKQIENLQKKLTILQNEEVVLEEQVERLQEKVAEKESELADRKEQRRELAKRLQRKMPNEVGIKREGLDDERRDKDITEWLKDKLVDLIHHDPSGNQEMIFKHVTVKYLPELYDGDFDDFEKIDCLEARFKINKRTTFSDLKENACRYWNIQDNNSKFPIALRANNYAMFELMDDQPIEHVLIRQRIMPEFWLFRTNNQAHEVFTKVQDCCNY